MRAVHQRVATIAAISLLALLFGTAMEAVVSTPHTVYTVAEIQAGLARRPAVWVGRIVRLRGIAISSYCVLWPSPADTACPGWRHVIADPCVIAGPCAVNVLPLAGGAPDSLPTVLHRLPLVGRLVPAPGLISWGEVGTYRVQLRAAPADVCPSPPCYQVHLLDAAP
jgi:hypothetical protein